MKEKPSVTVSVQPSILEDREKVAMWKFSVCTKFDNRISVNFLKLQNDPSYDLPCLRLAICLICASRLLTFKCCIINPQESYENQSEMYFRRTMNDLISNHHFLHHSLTVLIQSTWERFKSRFWFCIFFPFQFFFPSLKDSSSLLWTSIAYKNIIIFGFLHQSFIYFLLPA